MDDITKSLSGALKRTTAFLTTFPKLSPRSAISNKSLVGMTGGFCPRCSKMIEDGFQSFTTLTCTDARPTTIRRSQGFLESDMSMRDLTFPYYRCGFCGFLLSVLRSPDSALLRQVRVSGWGYNPNRVKLKIGLKLQYSTPSQQIDQLEMRMHVSYRIKRDSKQTQPLPDAVHKYLPVFSTADRRSCNDSIKLTERDPRLDSSEKIEMTLAWLARHPADATMDIDALPTRLLDIKNISRIRIVEYISLSKVCSMGEAPTCSPVRYAALSHRWGTSRHLIATSKNLQTLQDGVDLWDLPRNFGNATLFALQLGIRYLWVDALCIVQDDLGDWYRESQKMGDIFTNAAVTFAVHSAKDDAGGFLTETLSKLPTLEHRCKIGNIRICLPPQPGNDITNSDLSKRGWVFQERFLSQRTVHLTRGQIYLESHEGLLCEDGTLLNGPKDREKAADDTKPRLYYPHALQDLRSCLGLTLVQGKPHQVAETTLQWLCVIEMYSRCDLTRETDKLIAIAGMARKMQKITKQIWCAGLWADRICQSLLWCPNTSGITAPQDIRAPSWSWAFWDGAIQYPIDVWHADFQPRAVFERVCSDEEGFQETAWLNGPGQLVLRGRLVPLYGLDMEDDLKFGPGQVLEHRVFQMPHATWNEYVNVTGVCELGCNVPDGWFVLGHHHSNDPKFEVIGRKAHFLILGTHLADQGLLCLGLFLESAFSHNNSQLYKRMGVGHLEWDYVYHHINGVEHGEGTPGLMRPIHRTKGRLARDLANDLTTLDNLFAKDKLTEVFVK